jgi:hypothetical protein
VGINTTTDQTGNSATEVLVTQKLLDGTRIRTEYDSHGSSMGA